MFEIHSVIELGQDVPHFVKSLQPIFFTFFSIRIVEMLPGVGFTLARRLLQHFGSIGRIMRTSPRKLAQVRGLSARGAETLLDEDDPRRDFFSLMTLLAESFGDAPTVLDVNSGRWHPRRALDEHFGAGTTPPEDVLWMTHVIVSAPGDATASAWIHTHGLRRCGRPDSAAT